MHHRSSNVARTLGAVLALLLAASLAAVAAPIAGAQDPPPGGGPTPISSGSLVWGVKDSWSNYVSLPYTHVSGGASIDADRTLTFPLTGGSYDAETGTTAVQFVGSVRYASYCGFQGIPEDECFLDLTITDPRVVIDGERQVMEAHVLSRPRSLDPFLPVVDYGVIPLVTLDITEASVLVADGLTRWSGILAALTEEAAPAFGYRPGTAFDPVSFSYTGPGGKPDLGEVWATPGTPKLEEDRRWVDTVLLPYPDALYVDDQGIAHLVTGTNRFEVVPFVRAFDASTLTPIDTAAYSPEGTQTIRAFDPVAGRVFVSRQVTVEGVATAIIDAVRYDPGTRAYVVEQVTAVPSSTVLATLGSAVAWDPSGQRLVGIVIVRDGAARIPTLFSWRRVDGAWVEQREVLDDQPEGFTQESWYSPGPEGFAVAADGSLLVVRNNVVSTGGNLARAAVLRLVDGPEGVAWEEVAGTGSRDVGPASPDRYRRVVTGRDGAVWFAIQNRRFQEARVAPEGGGIALVGTLVELSATFGSMTVDPADGTLWLKNAPSQELAALRDSRVVFQQAYTDFGAFDDLAVTADHTVYSTLRVDSATPQVRGIARFAYLGTSPTVTVQPEPVAVTLGVGVESEPVSFTAEATGDPEPTVRWQRRGPGMSSFADLPGATSTALEVQATPSDDGAAYRAVFSNAAGEVPTEPATLDVEHAPVVTFQPSDVTVVAGGGAQFPVQGVGNPDPEVTWQRLVGGFWTDVDPASGDVVVNGGFLDIPATTMGMDGAQFRAKVTNEVATVFSRVATLSVVPVPDAGTVTGGHLDWGVKQSFRDYVTGPIAEGEITLSDGATQQPDGTFRFPAVSGTLDLSGTTTAAFEGSVHFQGHHGVGGDPELSALDLRISNLRLQDPPGPEGGKLVADVVSREFEGFESSGEPVTYLDVPLADLDLSGISPTVDGDAFTWTGVPATLTGEGAPAFAAFYEAGTGLDPLTWVLEVDTEPIAPAITAGPADLTVLAGADVAFEAAATGNPPPALRWQRLVDGLWWVDIEGATGPTLALPDVPVQASGTKVRVQATSSAGTATSAVATLTVLALPDFPDVGGEGPFTLPIAWLVDQGITTGYPDGTFRPTEVVTRQVAAAFLHRMAGSPPPPPGAPTFSDVPGDHPFAAAIAWLAATGTTTGYPDGTFRPTEVVTRQSVAAFLHRMAGSPEAGEGAPTFSDVPGDHPFAAAIAWLADQGIATGYPDGTFHPGEPITRQTMAAFLYRDAHRSPVG